MLSDSTGGYVVLFPPIRFFFLTQLLQDACFDPLRRDGFGKSRVAKHAIWRFMHWNSIYIMS